MEHNVGQDVLYGAAPGVPFAVLVCYFFGKCGRSKLGKIIPPQFGEFFDLGLALIKEKLRPHGKALSLRGKALQPQALGRKDVGQKVQGTRQWVFGCAGRNALDRKENFTVSPCIVLELASEIVK